MKASTYVKVLNIASGFSIPLDAVTQTIAIMAVRGVGKTHTAVVLAEEMLKQGQPVCIYDPTGAWYGLKSSKDGKKPGFPVVIFGGEHADVPLEETAGATIAKVIVDRRIPTVLDVSLMRKAARIRFMTDFAETLYHRNRDPLHVIFDEAQTVAPQKLYPESAKLLGAIEDIFLQGRRRGLGCTLISQRPALVNKNVLTQCSVLIAMRIIGPQDRAAIDDWIDAHGDKAEAKSVLASLPSLQRGEGWVWSPGWLRSLTRVRFRERETFDSSATPEVNKHVARPTVVAEIDLEALGDEIRQTVEKTKADDPRVLKQRIAELERQLAKPAQIVEKIVNVVPASLIDGTQLILEEVQARATADLSRELAELINKYRTEPPTKKLTGGSSDHGHHSGSIPRTIAPRSHGAINRPPDPVGTISPETRREIKKSGGSRRMLIALAQRQRTGLSAKQLGVRAGLSPGSGTFSTYLAALRSQGYIDGSRSLIQITDAGLAFLGDYDPLPTGRELLAYWLNELGGGASRMLAAAAAVYPAAMTAEEVGEAANISAASGTFSTYLAKLRKLELVEGTRDRLRASAELFE